MDVASALIRGSTRLNQCQLIASIHKNNPTSMPRPGFVGNLRSREQKRENAKKRLFSSIAHVTPNAEQTRADAVETAELPLDVSL